MRTVNQWWTVAYFDLTKVLLFELALKLSDLWVMRVHLCVHGVLVQVRGQPGYHSWPSTLRQSLLVCWVPTSGYLACGLPGSLHLSPPSPHRSSGIAIPGFTRVLGFSGHHICVANIFTHQATCPAPSKTFDLIFLQTSIIGISLS